ncbi:protein-tyrosine phosphatase-like protein [Catenaria anguillulae PL171]|uniref:protein-tyrosine-phosphatase n=1 Tax=Catenaria anguillulae PL171 TaxID=765915 RepID=A0A1Y2HWR4_9FUNG|nr:protein-tyrosine phosphatase-like protein [Catenaria anguillulae PL171]
MAFECVPPTDEQRRAANIQLYKHIATQDSADERIELVLRDATVFIHDARKANHTVYVHCKAGKSRSATVVIAYLMLYHGYSFDAAWSHVKAMRPAVAPNIGFFGLLRELNGKTLSALTPSSGSVLPTPASAGSGNSLHLSALGNANDASIRNESRSSHHAMP